MRMNILFLFVLQLNISSPREREINDMLKL